MKVRVRGLDFMRREIDVIVNCDFSFLLDVLSLKGYLVKNNVQYNIRRGKWIIEDNRTQETLFTLDIED